MKVDNLHVDESQETTTRMIHILWDVHTARPAFGNTEATLANIGMCILHKCMHVQLFFIFLLFLYFTKFVINIYTRI